MSSPEADPQFTIARLNKKINDDQLEIARMLEDNQLMQAALESKKASEQLAAWAIDRAIETHKYAKDTAPTPETVMESATKYLDYIACFSEQKKTVN